MKEVEKPGCARNLRPKRRGKVYAKNTRRDQGQEKYKKTYRDRRFLERKICLFLEGENGDKYPQDFDQKLQVQGPGRCSGKEKTLVQDKRKSRNENIDEIFGDVAKSVAGF